MQGDGKLTIMELTEPISKKQVKRWLRSLEIAKILFEEDGYHTRYLEEIKSLIENNQDGILKILHQGED